MFSFLPIYHKRATETLETRTINESPPSVGLRSNTLGTPFEYRPIHPQPKVKTQAYEPYKNHYETRRRTNSAQRAASKKTLENMKYATEILRQMNHMENEKEEVDDLNSCYSSATVEARQGSNKPHIPEDGLDNIANECDTVRDSVAEIAAGIGQIVIVRRNSGAAYKKPQSIRHFTLSTNLRPNPHLSNNLVRWREEVGHHLRRSSSSDMHVVLPTTAAEVRRCRYSVKRKVRCIIKCETRVRFKKSH
ncbi:hypothetical protein B0H10DRAFT_1959019 [Mycena sp. CBHHK59/15]|nr:hypothetical protein B0H10DRAFT_1959019 [Mycena sp. CBHHK59/15]